MSCGCFWKCHLIENTPCSSSTLALGTFPGPIIRANKVGFAGRGTYYFPSDRHTRQGDHFQLEVIDKLTDKSLDLVTSIVRFFFLRCDLEYHSVLSVALAWPLPKDNKLRRWSCVCHPVSNCTTGTLLVQLYSPASSGTFPFSLRKT